MVKNDGGGGKICIETYNLQAGRILKYKDAIVRQKQ